MTYQHEISSEYHCPESQTTDIRCYKGPSWEYTPSPAFFNTTTPISTIFYSTIITPNPINPRPTEPSNHTIPTEFTSRQGILHYTYWLTVIHSGNFRDIPLIEVSVEGFSIFKHCRKKRRPITCTVDAQEQKGGKKNSLIKQAQRRQNIQIPRSELPCLTRACLSHVTSSSNIRTSRLDVMHASDTHQTAFTQTLLSPNALALLHQPPPQIMQQKAYNFIRKYHNGKNRRQLFFTHNQLQSPLLYIYIPSTPFSRTLI